MLVKENTKDWRLWWQLITRYWYVLALAIMITIGIGLYLAFTITPLYESRARVLSFDTDLLSGTPLRFVPNASRRSDIEYFRRLITSDSFLEKLIERSKVKQDPDVIIKVEQLSLSFNDIPREEIIRQVCLKALKKRISTDLKAYNLLEIKARAKTSHEAFELCKEVTQFAIAETKEDRIQYASVAQTFNNELLTTYKKRIESAEERLRKFKQDNNLTNRTELRITPEKAQEIKSLLLSTEIDLQVKQEDINSLDKELGDIPAIYDERFNTNISEIRKKLFQRTRNLCQLLQDFNWRDLEIIVINEEIARLKRLFNEEISDIVIDQAYNFSFDTRQNIIRYENLSLDKELITYMRNEFELILNTYYQMQREQPTRTAYLDKLQSELSTTQEIYNLLLQQERGTQIRLSAQQQEEKIRFKLLVPPQHPLERIRPNRRRILMISGMFGIIIGLGIIGILESFTATVKNVNDISEQLKVPVLATIPRMNNPLIPQKTNKFRKILYLLFPTLALSIAALVFML